ncbi:MAG: hypothetical protein JNL18_11310 [Planctomycetaceae bacterium]|nr:hypothetical protein [Planctomycetaceae bacterium]
MSHSAPEQPLPDSVIALEQLFKDCRSAMQHCRRIVNREQRKAQVFHAAASGEITASEFARRVKSLDDAHNRHLDEGVPDLDEVIAFTNLEGRRQANERIEAGMALAERANAGIQTDPGLVGSYFVAFHALLDGWDRRIALLEELSDRIVAALKSVRGREDTRGDTEKKVEDSLPRNLEIAALHHFIDSKQYTGKSQNELIKEFASNGAKTSVSALRRGLSRYRQRLRDIAADG